MPEPEEEPAAEPVFVVVSEDPGPPVGDGPGITRPDPHRRFPLPPGEGPTYRAPGPFPRDPPGRRGVGPTSVGNHGIPCSYHVDRAVRPA